jgi:hypothetical protein
MSMDSELQKHYGLLLGVGSPWEVKTVDLNLEAKKVEIELGWQWGAASLRGRKSAAAGLSVVRPACPPKARCQN